MDALLILPNTLFEDNKLIKPNMHVYIYEHPIFFTKYKYHKLKLILHRATMKNYEQFIKDNYKVNVTYIEYHEEFKIKCKKLELYDPVDHDVAKQLKKYAKSHNINLFIHDTPLFMTTLKSLNEYLEGGGTFHQTAFYIWQRKRLNILLTKDSKPIGNKWTYDTENRKPFPKNFKEGPIPQENTNKYVIEAKKYINKHFPDNYGSDEYYLSTDFNETKKNFKQFIKNKLKSFGPYQDAVNKDVIFGCHSIISPLLNVGIITPAYIIDIILKYHEKHKLPIESVEGYIRQIIGWREIVRMMYMFKHDEMKNSNYFGHKRKLSKTWYTGETKMIVIDDLINKVLKYAYAHHIERLMYLGNMMLLLEIEPNDIFKWFMELFIDSYQWVMEANVYAMSSYSTGPLLMTRPYFSSSNYISKMSSYKKVNGVYDKIEGYEWFEVWDALYYNFIKNNKVVFSKNYAIANGVANWNKKSDADKNKIVKIAKMYLDY